MRKKEIASRLLLEVQKIFPDASSELTNWHTPFQFLVCIMLSAQTTDKQVNKVTEGLFLRYSTSRDFKEANLEELQNTLGGINYYKTKSKHLIQMASIIHDEYGGEPPVSLSKLLKLPGVGYKTANVFLNDFYKANEGIAVDTHVLRVARAYGLTKHTDPTKISHDLEKLYPKEDWYKVNSTFVLYGRYIFKAKKPDMKRVVLKEYLVN